MHWRKKHLKTAINDKKRIALIGIGDIDNYNTKNLESDLDRLKKSNCDYTVYDISTELVNKAKEKGINAELIDITKNPLPSKFDLIIASDVIEHVYSPFKMIDHLINSLTKDGKILITTPNCLYWRQFIILREFHEHLQGFNLDHFKNISKHLNLKILELNTYQEYPEYKTSLLNKLSLFLGKIFNSFKLGDHILFIASKQNLQSNSKTI